MNNIFPPGSNYEPRFYNMDTQPRNAVDFQQSPPPYVTAIQSFPNAASVQQQPQLASSNLSKSENILI